MDSDSIPNLHLGTSSWSAESWLGPFYPPGTPPTDFLPFYATQFRTVEIDSTYYRIPPRKMVQGWRDRTPPCFIFAAKFPGERTHKKLLVDCERETDKFLGVMARPAPSHFFTTFGRAQRHRPAIDHNYAQTSLVRPTLSDFLFVSLVLT